MNWHRKDERREVHVARYGENSRVLAWIFRRCVGTGDATATSIGLLLPIGEGGIDTDGLDVSDATMARLVEVDTDGW